MDIEILKNISIILVCIVAAKAILIGSDFDFAKWIKYGKEYRHWYDNRPEFKSFDESN